MFNSILEEIQKHQDRSIKSYLHDSYVQFTREKSVYLKSLTFCSPNYRNIIKTTLKSMSLHIATLSIKPCYLSSSSGITRQDI